MKKGFTLIELLVALFITMIVLSIGYITYIKIMKGSLFQSSISSSQISTLSGTSLMQYDISMCGYGLALSGSANFQEATNSTASNYNYNSLPVSAYNIGQNTQTNPTSSYLVIRSAIADINSASQKYAVAYYNSNTNNWDIDCNTGDSNFSPNSNDYCVVMNSSKTLLNNPNGSFYFTFSNFYNSINTLNLSQSQIYLIYGLNPKQTPRMPFNRVDYFLSKAQLASYCDPDTYELYRSVINQADGSSVAMPLLDCVKAFYVQSEVNGAWYSNTNGLNPNIVNSQTQLIKVFILQQSSKYSNSVITTNSIAIGDSDTGTIYTFSPNQTDSHYEWKVIEMTIKPMNIGQNQ